METAAEGRSRTKSQRHRDALTEFLADGDNFVKKYRFYPS